MREKLMKKIILFLSLVFIIIIFICFYDMDKESYNSKMKSVNLAIYINDEQTSTIPDKEAGYLFDEEKSSCTSDATIEWDNDTWSPVILNAENYPVRCNIAFRDFYRIKVTEGETEETYQVATSQNSTSIQLNEEHVLLSCNKGVTLKEETGQIIIENIESDVYCTYYDNSVEAINNVDETKTYFLYLQDESLTDHLTLLANKELTMDINGHTLSGTGELRNYAKLYLVSINTESGNLDKVVRTYESSYLEVNSIEVSSTVNTIHVYDTSDVVVNDSRVISSDKGVSSAIWLHGGKTNFESNNSYIEGPYAVGGEGGNIRIISSNLVGSRYTALQVNEGFLGDAIISGSSTLNGQLYGVYLTSGGNLTLEQGSDGTSPIIRGNTSSGIYVGLESAGIFNFYAGDIYGAANLNINGTINVLEGKTMKTVNENSVYHTYLE